MDVLIGKELNARINEILRSNQTIMLDEEDFRSCNPRLCFSYQLNDVSDLEFQKMDLFENIHNVIVVITSCKDVRIQEIDILMERLNTVFSNPNIRCGVIIDCSVDHIKIDVFID